MTPFGDVFSSDLVIFPATLLPFVTVGHRIIFKREKKTKNTRSCAHTQYSVSKQVTDLELRSVDDVEEVAEEEEEVLSPVRHNNYEAGQDHCEQRKTKKAIVIWNTNRLNCRDPKINYT